MVVVREVMEVVAILVVMVVVLLVLLLLVVTVLVFLVCFLALVVLQDTHCREHVNYESVQHLAFRSGHLRAARRASP